uniref:Uncharacterized protein n=1 Tax=Pseudomonas phage RVTF4 TaxID=3236931 RepID=A0AB39CCD1_9VIRU
MEYLVNPVYKLFSQLEVTPIELEAGGEMIRVGAGRHKFRPFARVDLWSKAYRVTVKSK